MKGAVAQYNACTILPTFNPHGNCPWAQQIEGWCRSHHRSFLTGPSASLTNKSEELCVANLCITNDGGKNRCCVHHTLQGDGVFGGRGGGMSAERSLVGAPPNLGVWCTVAGTTVLGIHSLCTNKSFGTQRVHKINRWDTPDAQEIFLGHARAQRLTYNTRAPVPPCRRKRPLPTNGARHAPEHAKNFWGKFSAPI